MKRKALIALVLGIALTVVPAANAMWLSDGGGSSNSVKLTPQQAQFYVLHGTVPGVYVGAQPSIKLTPSQAQSITPLKTNGDSFAWGDAALGAAAVLAAMLLATATVIGTRRRSHRLSF